MGLVYKMSLSYESENKQKPTTNNKTKTLCRKASCVRPHCYMYVSKRTGDAEKHHFYGHYPTVLWHFHQPVILFLPSSQNDMFKTGTILTNSLTNLYWAAVGMPCWVLKSRGMALNMTYGFPFFLICSLLGETIV